MKLSIESLQALILVSLYDAKSEESDQTPLLYPEKTLTRSLSLDSRAKFSNLTMRAEYGENLLEYEEAVAVEEKDY